MLQKVPYNLIMLTLDCVRPDHLGCYGYSGVETPHLDGLAARGVLFEQAVAHAPNTWVSHATLFTGLLPAQHGLRAATHRLSPHGVTLAEWLSGHGYATAGFPGTSLVGRSQGFQRGVHFFHDAWERDAWQIQEVLWRANWEDAWSGIVNWMEGTPEPFFLWIHYMDTHHLPEFQLPEYYRLRFSPRWQHYDGKISHSDQACVARLLSSLKDRGRHERTVLMVFSDHGEELREDDRPLHDGGLGEDVIRIPLIIALPPEMERLRARVPEQVRLVDLFPTACELLGLPNPPHLQGRSLVPLLRGDPSAGPDDSLAYLENWPRGYLGIRTPSWKLILRHSGDYGSVNSSPRVDGLYHLPTDPRERVDLSSEHPSVLEQLRDCALKWANGATPTGLDPEEMARVRRALEGLGYL